MFPLRAMGGLQEEILLMLELFFIFFSNWGLSGQFSASDVALNKSQVRTLWLLQ